MVRERMQLLTFIHTKAGLLWVLTGARVGERDGTGKAESALSNN